MHLGCWTHCHSDTERWQKGPELSDESSSWRIYLISYVQEGKTKLGCNQGTGNKTGGTYSMDYGTFCPALDLISFME